VVGPVLFSLLGIAPLADRPPLSLRAAAAAEPEKKDPVSDADRRFWSFQKLRPSPPPAVRHERDVRTPVDAFILQKLEAKGLTLAPEADRRALIRRASLDLTGLPPSPEEVQAFLDDHEPGAVERVVDRLIASPRFGERWGRHWLDVVGFVDTVGFDVDADMIITSDGKWRYRDYVIRSINADKPYDRFLVEQLAGDELVDWRSAPRFTPEIRELLVATGFLRTAQDFTHEDVGNIPLNHYGVLHDTIEIVGSSLLGLTLNCARCHSHKFDPVPQEDYYRLMAVFTPAYNPKAWKVVIPYDPKLVDRTVPDVSAAERAEIDRHNAELDRQTAELNRRLVDLRRPHRERLLGKKLAALPEPIRADVKLALETPADKRNEVQKYLAGKLEGSLKITPEELAAALSPDDKSSVEKLNREVAALKGRRQAFGKIQALFDVGPPPPTFRLLRGNHETPGPEVSAGVLRVLCEPGSTGLLAAEPPNPQTSGRRLALARWLTAPGTPASALVARVMVNRAWQALLGKGIVPTPENFGKGGEPPTHPELLEWLSAQLVEDGWRLKPLVRLIATSAVYRQATEPDDASQIAEGAKRDPDNRLLWHARLKRLESEAVRDSILSVSGAIDPAMGGPPVMLEARTDGTVVVAEAKLPTPTAKWRRSIYLVSRRAFHLSLMTVFDQPVVATNCPERQRSAVPLQSLTMLNDPFLADQSERFAARVDGLARGSSEEIAWAFRLALGRGPEEAEARWCAELLDREAAVYRQNNLPADAARRKALAHLGHTLLNTSEFLYTP
jgi:hypothetical protein